MSSTTTDAGMLALARKMLSSSEYTLSVYGYLITRADSDGGKLEPKQEEHLARTKIEVAALTDYIKKLEGGQQE